MDSTIMGTTGTTETNGATGATAATAPNIFTINGKVVALKYRVADLTVKDWKALERDGLTFETMKTAAISQVARLVHQVVLRSAPDVTMDDLDALSLETLKDLLAWAQAPVPPDRPT